MNYRQCDVLVIGAGPGGYACAIRAGQLGLDTVIIDREELGGTCLNIGCIPSKALIHVASEFYRMQSFSKENDLGILTDAPAIDFSRSMAWKDRIVSELRAGVSTLLASSKVSVVHGAARFLHGKAVIVETASSRTQIDAAAIVIATGSAPVEVPSLPFGGPVISSTEALSLKRIPKSLAVVGGGYIGLEIGTALAKLGCTVTCIEAEDRLLSQFDDALVRPVVDNLKKLGVACYLQTQATGVRRDSGGKDRTFLAFKRRDGSDGEVEAEAVLVTVGRKPMTAGLGLEELKLRMAGEAISIDSKCRTSMSGVYAIGDVTGDPMLAHRAMFQGVLAAEHIAGRKVEWDHRSIPAVCYTDPEIVTTGLTPDEAKSAAQKIDVTTVPMRSNGRALTQEQATGFVRVLSRADTGLIVGIQAVGADIAELSAAFSLAIEMGTTVEDIAGTIHAHPTKSEQFLEAAGKALGTAIHSH